MSFLSDLVAGSAEGLFGGVAKIIGTMKADPLELAKLEAAVQSAKQQYEQNVVMAVNASMQAEAHSEHWMQWSWRPVCGFTFCATIINNFIAYPYLAKFGMVSIVIPSEVWMAMLAVLGVSAYVRGRDK